jgi:hypothetical protein
LKTYFGEKLLGANFTRAEKMETIPMTNPVASQKKRAPSPSLTMGDFKPSKHDKEYACFASLPKEDLSKLYTLFKRRITR